jgi:hypothetical protein
VKQLEEAKKKTKPTIECGGQKQGVNPGQKKRAMGSGPSGPSGIKPVYDLAVHDGNYHDYPPPPPASGRLKDQSHRN